MNIFESAYCLIAMVVFCGTWWLMLDSFVTPHQSKVVRLAWMATFGIFVAFVAGLLWPLTLFGFILIAVVTSDG